MIGSGDHPFQFIHANDLAEVSIASALQEKSGIYNVGTDRFGSLRQDLGFLIKQSNSRSHIRSLPVRPTIATLSVLDKMGLSPLSPWHYLTYHKPYYFDSSSITTRLGWKPKYSNQEMLLESYNWFLENADKPRETDVGQAQSIHKSPVKQKALKILKFLSKAA